MNRTEKQEIEEIRLHMIQLIGDDAHLFARFSSITSHLWRISHKTSWTDRIKFKFRRIYNKCFSNGLNGKCK